MKHRHVAFTFALIIVTAFAQLAWAGSSRTGIEGRAFHYIAYGTPVEVEPGVWIGVGDVQLPVVTSFRILTANTRKEVARVTTDAEGRYSVTLKPGKYLLVPEPLIVPQIPEPKTVTADPLLIHVSAKQYTAVNIFYFSQM